MRKTRFLAGDEGWLAADFAEDVTDGLLVGDGIGWLFFSMLFFPQTSPEELEL